MQNKSSALQPATAHDIGIDYPVTEFLTKELCFIMGSIGSQIAKLVRESTGLEERSSVSLFVFLIRY